MRRWCAFVALCALSLSGCDSGPGSTPATGPSSQIRHLVWVISERAGALVAFDLQANGNVVPANIVQNGDRDMFGLAIDADGTLHASRLFGQPNSTDIGSVDTFLPSNPVPISRLTGPGTQLAYPVSIAFDRFHTLYVSGGNGIAVYAAGAAGNIAPTSVRSSNYLGTARIALDENGTVYATCCGGEIVSFAASSAQSGTPTTIIAGALTQLNGAEQIAIAGPQLFVANRAANSILVFDRSANGNVPPLRSVAGPLTKLNGPRGIAVTTDGTIYVSNVDDNSIGIYAPGANGNVAPIASIQGSFTGLDFPGAMQIVP
jgi:hypothetical protein